MQKSNAGRLIAGVLAIGILGGIASTANAAATVDGPRVKWNYAAWGNPKAAVWTIFVNLSKFLNERTGGKFTMDVHFGQLSKPKAILARPAGMSDHRLPTPCSNNRPKT